jgi:hypothetical protein
MALTVDMKCFPSPLSIHRPQLPIGLRSSTPFPAALFPLAFYVFVCVDMVSDFAFCGCLQAACGERVRRGRPCADPSGAAEQQRGRASPWWRQLSTSTGGPAERHGRFARAQPAASGSQHPRGRELVLHPGE